MSAPETKIPTDWNEEIRTQFLIDDAIKDMAVGGEDGYSPERFRSEDVEPFDFCALVPSDVAAPVHEAMITYFKTYPKWALKKYRRDHFLEIYEDYFCTHKKNNYQSQIPWPSWFVSVIRESLLFYAQSLGPYYDGLGCALLEERDSNAEAVDARWYYLVFLWFIGRADGVNPLSVRIQSGLMRKEQLFLIAETMKRMIGQLATLLSLDRPENMSQGERLQLTETEKVRLVEAYRITHRAAYALRRILEIRSERFEVLVTRYLEKDELHEQVVHDLEAAQRAYEDGVHEGTIVPYPNSAVKDSATVRGWLDPSGILQHFDAESSTWNGPDARIHDLSPMGILATVRDAYFSNSGRPELG
ncbi:hypothetical protein BJ508DRAFT_337881 [Ascobolus immersus RN42]|uniref:Uncharacterized protein n=1 Tax=Ascobolus immersus RN42 TaxID=1160509 RepID=A0A3N4HWU0_ASCIM|nr:hypothetical protein BJ508DRAFT_337881 [Ascobolus immersus RN42]